MILRNENRLKTKLICYAETIRIFLEKPYNRYALCTPPHGTSGNAAALKNLRCSFTQYHRHTWKSDFIMFFREEMRKKFSSSFLESLVTCSNSCVAHYNKIIWNQKNESFLICPQITKYVSLLPHTTSFMVLNVKINATAY